VCSAVRGWGLCLVPEAWGERQHPPGSDKYTSGAGDQEPREHEQGGREQERSVNTRGPGERRAAWGWRGAPGKGRGPQDVTAPLSMDREGTGTKPLSHPPLQRKGKRACAPGSNTETYVFKLASSVFVIEL